MCDHVLSVLLPLTIARCVSFCWSTTVVSETVLLLEQCIIFVHKQLELREYDDGMSAANNGAAAITIPPEDETDEEKKESTSRGGGVVVSTESEMRGVHACAHIPPHTLIMSIPRRCLITVEMGQATPIGQAILHADLDLDAPKHIFLMIYLLWDRKVNGPNSFFYPYYEILPRTLQNMPIFWTKSELAELQGSYLLHQIADRTAAIAQDYHAICHVAPQLRQLASLAEFQWARMCVCSRNFGLSMDGHRTSALVPHADMLNHYRPRETKWTFDEDRQAFTITTLHAPIAAGAQVYDSYGQKCNHRFLLNYGFAVEDNRELDGFCPNEVPLELFVSASDPLYAEKLEFWTRGEQQQQQQPARILGERLVAPAPPVVKRIRVCASNNENTRLLFSLLRALACNEAELRTLASPVGGGGDMSSSSSSAYHNNNNRGLLRLSESALTGSPAVPLGASYHRSCRDIRHPVSLRNERAAMRLLLRILEHHLEAYPTTLAQDVTDLMDEVAFPRFSNRRHAKIQVRGEKEVLHHFCHWARTALDVLQVIEEELQDEQRDAVEVSRTGRVTVTEETTQRLGFDYVIRHMEEDDNVHSTILRYCADVLGSLRREEFKTIRRQRTHQQQQQQRSRALSSRGPMM